MCCKSLKRPLATRHFALKITRQKQDAFDITSVNIAATGDTTTSAYALTLQSIQSSVQILAFPAKFYQPSRFSSPGRAPD
jgi:hypothetical protein